MSEDVFCLRTFPGDHQVEDDLVALFELAESLAGNRGIMHEHIFSVLGGNKTVALF